MHDVLLLVNELVTNSVLHGGGHDVRVRAVAGDDCIRVEVSDVGPGFTVDGPQRLPAKAQATGRGLVIVERLATRWGVERRGGVTCVWFEIDR